MQILDGKSLSKLIYKQLTLEVQAIKEQYKITPGLAVFLIGNNAASQTYVNMKAKVCEQLGIYSQVQHVPNISQQEILDHINYANDSALIDGILVQLPLPQDLDTDAILEQININKDVDGFHPFNVGKLSLNQDSFLPCTPAGIMALLEHYKINVKGLNTVVIGRSNIVGKPIAMLLQHAGATVSICHSQTKDLKAYTSFADLLIVALGKPNFITADMVKENAIVIDVGINKTEQGLVGDVDFDAVKDKTSYITPVPGGVGPMTIAMLMTNTLKAAKLNRCKIKD